MTDLQFTDLPAEATVVFMQGPPGVGKTTQAEQLKKMLEKEKKYVQQYVIFNHVILNVIIKN